MWKSAKIFWILALGAPLLTFVVFVDCRMKIEEAVRENLEIRFLPSKESEENNVQVISHRSTKRGLEKGQPPHLVFDPPSFNFGKCPISMVWSQKVHVQNNHTRGRPITVVSISGMSSHFHCSFVRNKIIAPQGNTSFDIVFLGREVGIFEDTLIINTSAGLFEYRVTASGSANPYNLRPLVGVKMPINTTYTRVVSFHNPLAVPIQVLEVFSSSCDLHLELPFASENEPSFDWWLIPPYETRSVLRLHYMAKSEVNYTAFVRLRTNHTNQLVIPVELEVTAQPRIYAAHDSLEFGFMRSTDEPKTLKLLVFNSGPKPVVVQSVYPIVANDGLRIDFQPVKIPPNSDQATVVAQVTFSPSQLKKPRPYDGEIVIKSKNGQFKTSVQYRVTILPGELALPAGLTRFYVPSSSSSSSSTETKSQSCLRCQTEQLNGSTAAVRPTLAYAKEETSTEREILITNTFPAYLAVYNCTLSPEAKHFFQMDSFSPVVLGPGASASLLKLKLRATLPPFGVALVTYLTLHTNLTFQEVPLTIYSGKLTPLTFFTFNELNGFQFGLASPGVNKSMYLGLMNENPVDVFLEDWVCNGEKASILYAGVGHNNILERLGGNNLENLTMKTFVPAGQYALFHVSWQTPVMDGPVKMSIFVRTRLEELVIPIEYTVAKGSLTFSPQPLLFKDVFPHMSVSQTLYAESSFQQKARVLFLTALSPHLHTVKWEFSKTPVLELNKKVTVGQLTFDLGTDCSGNCYTGLEPNTTLGEKWLKGVQLPTDLAARDSNITWTLFNQYLAYPNPLDLTLFVNTELTKDILLKGQVHLTWPKLFAHEGPELQLPTTEISGRSWAFLRLTNPANVSVVAQPLLLHQYPGGKKLLQSLPSQLLAGISLENIETQRRAFFLSDPAVETSQKVAVEGQVVKESMMVYMSPGAQAEIQISFEPFQEGFLRTVVVLRNNLTGIELLGVTGKGGQSLLTVGNQRPGSNHPLLFNISEKHLKGCDRPWQSRYMLPSLTLKRSFVARNQGETPISILGLFINGHSCEGFGFKVLNCETFLLMPNQSHSLEIAFSPDFTQTRVQRMLELHTSVGGNSYMNFPLMATLPAHMLVLCAAIIPRPSWEIFLYYGAVCTVVLLLICVLTMACLEADNISNTSFVALISTRPDSSPHPQTIPVFDLKKIAQELPADENRNSSKKISPISVPEPQTVHQHTKGAPKKKNGHKNHTNERNKILEIPTTKLETSITKIHKEPHMVSKIAPSPPPAVASLTKTVKNEPDGKKNEPVAEVVPAKKEKTPVAMVNCVPEAARSPTITASIPAQAVKLPKTSSEAWSKPESVEKTNGPRVETVPAPKRNKKLRKAPEVLRSAPKSKKAEEDACSTTTESSSTDESLKRRPLREKPKLTNGVVNNEGKKLPKGVVKRPTSIEVVSKPSFQHAPEQPKKIAEDRHQDSSSSGGNGPRSSASSSPWDTPTRPLSPSLFQLSEQTQRFASSQSHRHEPLSSLPPLISMSDSLFAHNSSSNILAPPIATAASSPPAYKWSSSAGTSFLSTGSPVSPLSPASGDSSSSAVISRPKTSQDSPKSLAWHSDSFFSTSPVGQPVYRETVWNYDLTNSTPSPWAPEGLQPSSNYTTSRWPPVTSSTSYSNPFQRHEPQLGSARGGLLDSDPSWRYDYGQALRPSVSAQNESGSQTNNENNYLTWGTLWTSTMDSTFGGGNVWAPLTPGSAKEGWGVLPTSK